MALPVRFQVNGKNLRIEIDESTRLLWLLRDDLGLTGTKYGCGEGQCGACTVLLNGQPIRSCITPAASVSGKSITTIEGLAPNGRLHPVQQAFWDANAFQCGYCTAGMILASAALLEKNSHPTERDIKLALEGNLCRCCVYPRIVGAVQRAAELRQKGARVE